MRYTRYVGHRCPAIKKLFGMWRGWDAVPLAIYLACGRVFGYRVISAIVGMRQGWGAVRLSIQLTCERVGGDLPWAIYWRPGCGESAINSFPLDVARSEVRKKASFSSIVCRTFIYSIPFSPAATSVCKNGVRTKSRCQPTSTTRTSPGW